MAKREDKQRGRPHQPREDRDAKKRPKDLEPDKDKGREVKGGASRFKF